MADIDDIDDDILLQNVADLRKKLIRTEHNLHLLQTPVSQRDHRYRRRHNEEDEEVEDRVLPLTLDDLTPEHLTSSVRSTTSDQQRRSRVSSSEARTKKQSHRRERMEDGNNYLQNSSLSSLMGSTSLQETTENHRLRGKLQTLRDDNSQLVAQNHSLHNKIESTQYELRLTKGQLKMMNVEVETSRSTLASLKDKCDSLRTELKVNDSALRIAEKSLDESGRQLTERESLVQRHRKELKLVRSEVAEEHKLRKRMEVQRDETVEKLEELSDQLDTYRMQTQDKLTKLTATEDHLRGSLLHCDREREELLERATQLEEDLQDARDRIRMLQETGSRLQETETSLQATRSQAEEHSQRVQVLESELQARRRENQELTELTGRQSERLVECQKDMETSREQLRKMEKLVEKYRNSEKSSSGKNIYKELFPDQANGVGMDSGFGGNSGQETSHDQTLVSELRFQLAMKEVEIQQLKASVLQPSQSPGLSSLPELGPNRSPTGLRAQLAALMEKSKLGEKRAQELEKVIGQLNAEAVKRANEMSRLKQELAANEANRSSMESRMSLRDTQLSQLHSEVQQKASHIEDLEKEVRKRKGQLATLESQLEDKTSVFSSHVSKLQELQNQLNNQTSQLAKAEEEVRNKESAKDKFAAHAEEMRRLTQEQAQELHQQLDMMHKKMEKQTQELVDLQAEKNQLERELGQREERMTRLQEDLAESKKELVKKNVENQQLWNNLQTRADEGSLRLAQMDAALAVCKQELAMYVDQLEDGKKIHDQQISLKQKEVNDLEDRWRKASSAMDERGARVGELEQALKERQNMLQESTERIAELEDREGTMEQQISSLSRQLSQLQSAALEEAELMEKKLHQACSDLEDRSQQLKDNNLKLSAIQSELAQSKADCKDLERRLRDARQDSDNQTDKTAQLEKELHEAKVGLEEAQSRVKELEEVIERTRGESRETKDRCRELDFELQQAQEDMRAAASQLGDLHRLLQRSKAENKLQQERVQELNDSLRQSQEETRNKEQDLAEIDLALRTSQRELLHRSAQVTQLDVTVKERQSEMERQIIQLETSLNKTQYQLKQSKQKVSDLEESKDKQQQGNHRKALDIQDLEHKLQQERLGMADKSAKISQLEERIEKLSRDLQDQKDEYLDQGQQLRLSREQAQQATVNITELQRQLAEAQRHQDTLSSELDEALERCRSKDLDMARLAEEVGATRAQELALQAQYTSELQQIAKLRDAEVELKEEQVNHLQSSHAQLLASQDQLQSSHRLKLNQLQESEQHSRLVLEQASQQVNDLEADLAAAKEVIDATNEAIVIKESEIARLKAKVSGYERAMFGSRHQQSSHNASPIQSRSADANPSASASANHHAMSFRGQSLSPGIRDYSLLESPPRTSIDHVTATRPGLSPDRHSSTRPDSHRSTRPDIHRSTEPDTHRSSAGPSPDRQMGSNGSSSGNYARSRSNARPSPERHVYQESETVTVSMQQTSGGLGVQLKSPGLGDSMRRLGIQDVPGMMESSPGASDMGINRSGNHSRVQFNDKIDALSESTGDTSSIISGIERLPPEPVFSSEVQPLSTAGQSLASSARQPEQEAGTFEAMLAFVNQQIMAQGEGNGSRDTDWLNLEDMSDGSILLSPSRSTRTSTDATCSLSPVSPLRSVHSSPSPLSATHTTASPRRKSGIPLRKGPSPSRRALNFSKGNSGQMLQSSANTRRQKGKRTSLQKPSGKDKSSSDTTPLKQKLANQKAKLASHGKARSTNQSQLKPKECIADLQAKLKANDERRLKIDEQLFGVI